MLRKIWQNKLGFSLLSVLFSISILLFVSPLLASIIITISADSLGDSFDELSVSNFFYLLQQEINHAVHVQVIPSRLILKQNDDLFVHIERDGNNIIRRVNYSGYEILLFNVEKFDIRQEDKTILIKITTKERGGTYERRFVLNEVPA